MAEHSIPRDPSCHPGQPGTGEIEAVVQVGAREIRYRRAGSGTPVLLLHAETNGDSLVRHLLSVLAGEFRVIAPLPPTDLAAGSAAQHAPASTAFSTWVRNLVDGLGLVRPRIVADSMFGVALLSFALTDPERVSRLAIVGRDVKGESSCHGLLHSAAREAGHRVLLLWFADSYAMRARASDRTAELIRFLSAADDEESVPERT